MMQVILTDGDLSTLANMKLNLDLNQLGTDMLGHKQKNNTVSGHNFAYLCVFFDLTILNFFPYYSVFMKVG